VRYRSFVSEWATRPCQCQPGMRPNSCAACVAREWAHVPVSIGQPWWEAFRRGR
jgi:hypothetical protein